MLTMRRTVAAGVRMCAGLRRAEQDRADRHAVAAGDLQQVEGDVGGVEVGHDQQVGLARQRASRAAPPSRIASAERGVAVHLAVDLELGRALAQQRQRRAHLARRRRIAAAEARVRQQRHLGLEAEAAHLLGGQQRDLGELLGGRVDVDVGVDR